MTIAPEKLAELRAAAEKATPGERGLSEYDEHEVRIYGPSCRDPEHGRQLCRLNPNYDGEHDARYLAAADPTTVLALLDDLAALRARVNELEEGKLAELEFEATASRISNAAAWQAARDNQARAAELEQVVARVREVAAANAARAAELRSRPGNEHDNGRATAYEDAARDIEAALPKEPP